MENVAQLPLLFAADLEDLLGSDAARALFERNALPAYLIRQRWYRSKTRKLTRASLKAWTRFPGESEGQSVFALLNAEFEDGGTEEYVLPLAAISEEDPSIPPEAIVCRLSSQGGKLLLIDALRLPDFRAALLKISLNGTRIPLGDGILKGKPFPKAHEIHAPENETPSRLLDGEQSNSSILFEGLFLKLYRRLDEGIHPEPEILRFLEAVRYPHVPSFHAVLEWERSGQPPVTIAMTQQRIAAEENGWDYVLAQLTPASHPAAPVPEELADWVRLLGRRTAGLHLSLSSRPEAAAFAPEPLSTEDLGDIRAAASRLLRGALDALGNRNPKDLQALRTAMSRLERLEAVLAQAGDGTLGGKLRIHGDFHLGQILKGSDDVWFLDFEGEPARSLEEKRRKRSPLRDAAGMLRSFHYAAHVATLKQASHLQAEASATQTAPAIAAALGELFLEAYYEILGGSDLLPQDPAVRSALLDLFVLEKAVYELHYELNNRPDWVDIPLRGLATPVNP